MTSVNQNVVATPNLSTLVAPCLMLILHLRLTDEYGDHELLRERIKEQLKTIERDAKSANIAAGDIEKASFALVAFIDETIINSNWSQKEIWQSFPLQLELFNRYDAGDEYYVYLDSFRKHPQNHADLLEIYYQCMALGFKGKYQFQKREQLRDLIGDIYLDLRRSTDPSDIVLSPHGQRKDEIADAVKKGKLPIWPICIALATVGLLFYIIMLVWISGNAGSVADAIGQIR